jgi:hypothetical protein
MENELNFDNFENELMARRQNIEKAWGEGDIEKGGKRAQVGEIRTWNGKKISKN